MGKIDEAVIEQLKDAVPIDELAESLGLIEHLRQLQGKLVGKCPDHDSPGHTCCQLWEKENIFFCHQCKTAFDHFTLLDKAKKMSFREIAEYLAQNYRPDLLESVKASSAASPYFINRAEYKHADLFKMIYEWGKELLYTPKGLEAYNYLTKVRGYKPEILAKTDWMYWPKDEEVRKYLKSKLPSDRHHEIDELKFIGNGGDTFRSAFPNRDRLGKITGFIKRHTTKDGIKLNANEKGTRWSSPPGLTKDDLFGLYSCKRSKQFKHSKQLIIVEGYPDVLYLPALGLENIVAVSQGAFSDKYLEGLKNCGTESAIIIFDNDGKQHTLDNINDAAEKLEKAGIRSFIMPPEYMDDSKDPDEYVLKHGLDEFEKIVEKSLSRAHWLPHYFKSKVNIDSDLGMYKALSEASREYAHLSKGEQIKFRNAMSVFFKLSSEELEEELERALKKHQQEEAEAHRKLVEKQASDHLLKGDRNKALDLLDELEESEKKHTIPTIEPYTLDNLTSDLKLSKEGMRTGYEALDKYVTIQNQAITLIGGRPSHGKTTFMLNLFINLIRQYPKKNFYFFSYEETCQQIALKIINILSSHIFNEAKNLLSLEGYIKCGSTAVQTVEEAKKLYQEFVTSGRLRIVGRSYFASDLSAQIALLCKQEPIGGVFIDYIQKIKNKGRFGTRQLELQNTSEIILETAKSCSIPIILGAQLGRNNESRDKVKLDNLREAGDLEQDANLVLGLFNPSMEKAHEEGSQLTERCVEITVTPLKNRNGPVNIKVHLEFDRPLLTIQDKGAHDKKKASEALRNKRKDDKEWAL